MSARYVAAGHLRWGAKPGRVAVDPEFAALRDSTPLAKHDRAACERLRGGRQGRELLDSLVVATVEEVQS